MYFLHLDGLRSFIVLTDFVLDGELGKRKLVLHDDMFVLVQ